MLRRLRHLPQRKLAEIGLGVLVAGLVLAVAFSAGGSAPEGPRLTPPGGEQADTDGGPSTDESKPSRKPDRRKRRSAGAGRRPSSKDGAARLTPVSGTGPARRGGKGPHGNKGHAGNPGGKGPRGNKGPAGNPGRKGKRGSKGKRGPTGRPPSDTRQGAASPPPGGAGQPQGQPQAPPPPQDCLPGVPNPGLPGGVDPCQVVP